jgi:tRNA 2-thiouridine synthesizing protein A
VTTTTLLDATGLICPLPVLKARKALKAMPPGALLAVRATDPAAPKDFRAFCEATGHALVGIDVAEDGLAVVTIRKAG